MKVLKKSEEENRVLFHADECGVYLLPFCAKTWAPRGRTPVLKELKSREHLNLFGMISTRGDFCWQIQRTPFKAEDFEAFFTWLTTEGMPKTRMLIVWDGASIHKGEAVKNFLRNNPGVLHLEALPPYCPQLNAIELLWDYLKCQKLKNQVYLNLDELQKAVEKALNQIADDPELIQSFFTKDSVRFL